MVSKYYNYSHLAGSGLMVGIEAQLLALHGGKPSSPVPSADSISWSAAGSNEESFFLLAPSPTGLEIFVCPLFKTSVVKLENSFLLFMKLIKADFHMDPKNHFLFFFKCLFINSQTACSCRSCTIRRIWSSGFLCRRRRVLCSAIPYQSIHNAGSLFVSRDGKSTEYTTFVFFLPPEVKAWIKRYRRRQPLSKSGDQSVTKEIVVLSMIFSGKLVWDTLRHTFKRPYILHQGTWLWSLIALRRLIAKNGYLGSN